MSAVIVFRSNRAKFVSQEQAERIFWCLEGVERPKSRAQAVYLEYIKRVYLDRKTAPAEYLEKYALERGASGPEPIPQWWQERDNY